MELNRRKVLHTMAAAAATSVAFPYIAKSSRAAAVEHTLKLVYPETPVHPFMNVAKRFAENVKQKTDGAVEVQVFTTGQLGSQLNMLTSLQTGTVDLCAHTSGFTQTIYQPISVVDLPFLFKDAATAERVLDGPVGKGILDGMAEKGVYGLSYGHYGWRVVSTVERDVSNPASMKGMKIRVQPGPLFVGTFKELGALPVSIDLSELYLALSQRAIDAIETPMLSVRASKHEEVVKNINLTNHVYNPGVMMASKRKMDTLSKKHQDAIRAAAVEMTPDWRKTLGEASADAQQYFISKGLKMIEIDRAAYRKACDPIYAQYRETLGAGVVDAVLKQVG